MKKNIKAVFRMLQELNYILNKKQKRQAAVVCVAILISVVLELLGVSMVLPFLQALLSPEELMSKPILMTIFTALGVENDRQLLLFMGSALIFLYIFKNLFLILCSYCQYNYSSQIQMELSVKMLESYMTRPYTFFLDINSSELLRGCTGDIGAVYTIIYSLFNLGAESLTCLVISIYIIYTDPIVAFGTLFVLGILMLVLIFVFKPVLKRLGMIYMESNATKSKAILQTIQGVKELYVMQRKELFVEDYKKSADEVRKVQRNYDFLGVCPDRIIEGICVSAIIGIVIIRIGIGVEIASFVPVLGVFAMAAFKIFPSIGKIVYRINTLVFHFPMLENVYRNMQSADEYEIERGKSNKKIQEEESLVFHNSLNISHIGWKYNEQSDFVLKDVNIDIKKNESIALIGESGSGKTTLSDIILGLLQPQEGSVYVDGKDIYTMPKQWANLIGYVPQSVFLMDDTVRANVAFGLKDIQDDKIWDALEAANLKKFVQSLPDGLDTIVGERGMKFSGGQRQRIAIARALYMNPSILILDEATSALDTDTETAVMEAIEALQGSMTMIIIAHRLTTIRNCDKIYEIVDGKAVLRTKKEVFEKIS